jgi:hypothetical protein
VASAKVDVKQNGDILNISVSGYIGENAGLFDLNFTGVKKIVMDLSGVNYINSVGVKNWINWTGRFLNALQVEFHNCPSLIVNQVNMVAGFLPNDGTVESLSAPFICDKCNREESVPLKRGVHYHYATMNEGYKFTPPKVECPKCKGPMELDAVEAKFFNFLKSIRAS